MFSNTLLLAVTVLFSQVASQTYSNCNPLTSTTCSADTALGTAIDIDFTQGEVNSFSASGSPTYDSNGVSFTISKSGDSPQLESLFYIMFGKVEITMKAATGAGIVSTLVLQSDDLDEIDMEWLGADSTEVQTNYFGKGDVTTYNRGQFNPAANNQAEFLTYTIEWTESQITWSVGSTVLRVLTPATADTDQYPQTPMQIKFGAWAGGDASLNSAGTVSWARGPTDYSAGPFTMVVKSLAVTDYSTGTSYKYGDQSGNWTSIESVGGSVNGNIGAAGASVSSADVPSGTASPSIPAGLSPAQSAAAVSTSGIPAGWVITASGKVVPSGAVGSKTKHFTIPFHSLLTAPHLHFIVMFDPMG